MRVLLPKSLLALLRGLALSCALLPGVRAQVTLPAAQTAPLSPPTTLRHAQGLYLLAVGVDKYPPPYALASAVKDVRAIGEAFAQGAGLYGAFNARLLADEEATQANILEGLRWLADHVAEDHTGVVYLAGQAGMLHGNQYQFLPYDVGADIGGSSSKWVSGEAIARALQPARGRILVMADTVAAGGLAKPLVGTARANASLVVLLSSAADEMAAEDQHHGFFTQAVIDGFRLVSGDGFVRPLALSRYVAERVRTQSDGNQNPVIYFSGPDDPIARVRK